MQKKIIAREWLVFLVCWIFGIFFVRYAFYHPTYWSYSGVYSSAFDNYWKDLWGWHPLKTWSLTFIPYATAQLVRSIIWAAIHLTPKADT